MPTKTINAWNAKPGDVLADAAGECLGIVQKNMHAWKNAKPLGGGTMHLVGGRRFSYDEDMTFDLLPVAVELVADNRFNVCEDDPEDGATFDTIESGTLRTSNEYYGAADEDTVLLFGDEAREFLAKVDFTW